jgi:hypothetical protein
MGGTSMISTLEDLVRFIRQVLPRRLALENLRMDEATSVVRFEWQKKQFVVKRSLKVFELKGSKLYMSSHSILVQTALGDAHKADRLVETLRQ